MKRFLSSLVCFLLILCSGITFTACGNKADVVIYSSMESIRNEKLKDMLKEEFPDMKISVQYFPSGTNASKLKAEGTKSLADIVLDIDYGYLDSLKDSLADLGDIIDMSLFLDELIPATKKYVPLSKFSITMIVNEAQLDGVPIPETYQDLADKAYKNKIVMPNPSASGTGYGFVKGMVELMGEDEAFAYFEDMTKNVKTFSTSGSGPVNALKMGEAAIGLGMVFHAVNEINSGIDLTILTPSEGLPYNVSGAGIIKGHETNEKVKSVFRFFINNFLPYDKTNFMPEQIFKIQDPGKVENFPAFQNINMKEFSSDEKERLLKKWVF